MPDQQSPWRDLGGCEVERNGVSLGENVRASFRSSDDTAEIKTARGGTQPIDRVFTGKEVSLQLDMTRNSYAEIVAVTPGGSLSGNEMIVTATVGVSQRASAATYVVKPLVAGIASVDPTEWITIFIGGVMSALDLPFDAETQREHQVVISGFPANTSDIASGGLAAGYPIRSLWKAGSNA